MNKRLNIIFLLGLIVSIQHLHAQTNKDSSKAQQLSSFLKFQLSWNTGFIWEQRISKNSAIDFFGGILLAESTDNFSFFGSKAKFIIEPDAFLQYKNFYNFQNRVANKKRTANNSADFFFVRTETIFPVKNQNFFNLLFIEGWGAQRSLSKRFTIEGNLGVIEHFFYDKPPTGGYNYIKVYPSLSFSISYVF